MKYTTEELILAALTRQRAVDLYDVARFNAEKKGQDMNKWHEDNSPYRFIANATNDFENIAGKIREARSK